MSTAEDFKYIVIYLSHCIVIKIMALLETNVEIRKMLGNNAKENVCMLHKIITIEKRSLQRVTPVTISLVLALRGRRRCLITVSIPLATFPLLHM